MSGIYDLTSSDTLRALDEEARANVVTPDELPNTAWAGAGEAAGKNLFRASAGAGRAVSLLGGAVPVFEDWLTGVITGEKTDESQSWYFKHVMDGTANNAVDYWTPNPDALGSASKVIGVGANVVGSVPQILGTPLLFVAQSGLDPATEVVRQGGSAETAAAVGGINAGLNALGLKLPAAWGTSLATRLGTGAGTNLALGVAADAATAATLRAGGLEDMAQGYDAADPYARGLDVLMGLAFGYKAHIDAPNVATPAQRDAVLTERNHDHLARQTLMGEPTAAAAQRAHGDAMTAALRQLLDGEPVNVADTLNPADFILRPELSPEAAVPAAPGFAASVARVLGDEGGYVNDPVDRGGETKFGISKRAHPDIDIANLTRRQAIGIYRREYWDAIGADRLPADLQAVAFDAAVNQGPEWTRKALAEASGDRAKFLKLREARYREIVAADPTQGKFLRGWLNRLNRYTETNEAGAALRERLVEDPEQLARDYAALEDSKGGTVLNTDVARELSPEYLADRTRSADVHEAASDTVKTLYEAKLAQPTPEGMDPVVLFTAGGTGAGKTTAIDAIGEAFGRPEITYDTNMNSLGSSVDKIEQALSAGRTVRIAYVYRDPVEALTGGAIPRAERQAKKFGTGRTVPLEEHARTHEGVRPTMEALIQRYGEDPRVEFGFIDNSRGRGKSSLVASLADLPKSADNNLRERLSEALEEARSAGLDESLYQGFRADGRPQDRTGLGAGDGGRAEQGDRGEVTAESPLDAATRVAAESPDARVVPSFDADGAPIFRPLAEALDEIKADQARERTEAQAFTAAASCALRNGTA